MQSAKFIFGTSIIILLSFSFPKTLGYADRYRSGDICSLNRETTCGNRNHDIYNRLNHFEGKEERTLRITTLRDSSRIFDVRKERMLQIPSISVSENRMDHLDNSRLAHRSINPDFNNNNQEELRMRRTERYSPSERTLTLKSRRSLERTTATVPEDRINIQERRTPLVRERRIRENNDRENRLDSERSLERRSISDNRDNRMSERKPEHRLDLERTLDSERRNLVRERRSVSENRLVRQRSVDNRDSRMSERSREDRLNLERNSERRDNQRLVRERRSITENQNSRMSTRSREDRLDLERLVRERSVERRSVSDKRDSQIFERSRENPIQELERRNNQQFVRERRSVERRSVSDNRDSRMSERSREARLGLERLVRERRSVERRSVSDNRDSRMSEQSREDRLDLERTLDTERLVGERRSHSDKRDSRMSERSRENRLDADRTLTSARRNTQRLVREIRSVEQRSVSDNRDSRMSERSREDRLDLERTLNTERRNNQRLVGERRSVSDKRGSRISERSREDRLGDSARRNNQRLVRERRSISENRKSERSRESRLDLERTLDSERLNNQQLVREKRSITISERSREDRLDLERRNNIRERRFVSNDREERLAERTQNTDRRNNEQRLVRERLSLDRRSSSTGRASRLDDRRTTERLSTLPKTRSDELERVYNGQAKERTRIVDLERRQRQQIFRTASRRVISARNIIKQQRDTTERIISKRSTDFSRREARNIPQMRQMPKENIRMNIRYKTIEDPTEIQFVNQENAENYRLTVIKIVLGTLLLLQLALNKADSKMLRSFKFPMLHQLIKEKVQ